jgi:hypothetical protein
MKISFFEEFPDKIDFQKLQLLKFKPALYIASRNYQEFNEIKRKLSDFVIIWWVTLSYMNGYWISPFTPKGSLMNIFEEIKNSDNKVMLDVENPNLTPWLFISQMGKAKSNRKIICEFTKEQSNKLILCENAGKNICGVNTERIWMFYTSMIIGTSRRKNILLKKFCNEGIRKWGEKFKIGLGSIGRGILKIEPQLSVVDLERDLFTAYECGIKEAIIYRLGGVLENKKLYEKLNELAIELAN